MAKRFNSLKESLEFDSKLRKFIQNPQKIIGKYLSKDYIVLDFGCGPGFFTFEIANHLSGKGKVIAADINKESLDKLKNKISGLKISNKIEFHKCKENKIGLKKKVNFVLAFYVIHELKSKKDFFNEISKLMKPGAKMLIAEPIFHVTKKDFEEMIKIAKNYGLKIVEKPKIFFSRSVVFAKEDLT